MQQQSAQSRHRSSRTSELDRIMKRRSSQLDANSESDEMHRMRAVPAPIVDAVVPAGSGVKTITDAAGVDGRSRAGETRPGATNGTMHPAAAEQKNDTPSITLESSDVVSIMRFLDVSSLFRLGRCSRVLRVAADSDRVWQAAAPIMAYLPGVFLEWMRADERIADDSFGGADSAVLDAPLLTSPLSTTESEGGPQQWDLETMVDSEQPDHLPHGSEVKLRGSVVPILLSVWIRLCRHRSMIDLVLLRLNLQFALLFGGHRAAPLLPTGFMDGLACMTRLHTLDLHVRLPAGDEIKAVSSLPHLTMLGLTGVSDAATPAILACERLTHLRLTDPQLYGPRLRLFLSSARLARLSRLALCELDAKSAASSDFDASFGALTQLRYLHLARIHSIDAMLRGVVRAVSLVHLRVTPEDEAHFFAGEKTIQARSSRSWPSFARMREIIAATPPHLHVTLEASVSDAAAYYWGLDMTRFTLEPGW